MDCQGGILADGEDGRTEAVLKELKEAEALLTHRMLDVTNLVC